MSVPQIAALLVAALWATVSSSRAQAQRGQSQPQQVGSAAAAQLQRLAPFRRSGLDNVIAGPVRALPPPDPRLTRSSPKAKPAPEPEFRVPIDFVELFRIFSSDSEPQLRDKRNNVVQLTPARMDALSKYADKLMQDERVQSYMQERIKRDGYGAGYGYGPPAGGGGGSGAFVSGLAGQLVGSVVGLSSTASKTSSASHSPAPVYGPPAYHSVSASAVLYRYL